MKIHVVYGFVYNSLGAYPAPFEEEAKAKLEKTVARGARTLNRV